MTRGMIFDIMKYSIHDGPGIRTTVFLKGCPLYCWWCHNPESQAVKKEIIFYKDRCLGCRDCIRACPHNALQYIGNPNDNCTLCGNCIEVCYAEALEMVGREVSVQEVMEEIAKDLVFYDQSGGGVTFSGGEPLGQPDFLRDLLESCQEKGIKTAVDTTGFCKTDILLEIAKRVDVFLYDLKVMDDEKHKKYTGVSNELILKNLQELAMCHDNIKVRIPIIPGINDDDKNIMETGRRLVSLHNINGINILPYHKTGLDKYSRLGRNYKLPELKPHSDEKVNEIAEKLRGLGLKVKIGG